MNDYFKMFLVALVTTVAAQLLLTPYIIKLQGAGPLRGPSATAPAQPTAVASPAAVADKLTAPNLEGMKVEDARDRWRERGLVIIEDGERDGSGAAPGTIISQRPSPGAELSTKEVRVIVARKSEDVQVPDVVGKDLESARAELVELGFEVPEPQKQASEEEKGSVISQVPNPGARAKNGSVVRLVVAEAPVIAVPKVHGMFLSQAKKELDAAGLEVGSVRRVEHPERGENYVLRQDPSPGEEVPPGTEVELVVVAPN